MYWFKTYALLFSIYFVASCSFVPLYGADEKISLTIENKNATLDEQKFTKELKKLFAHKGEAQYRLIFSLSLSEQGLAVQPDRTISQKLQRGTLRWQLLDRKNKPLLNQTLRSSINFSQTGNYFARLTAAKEAKAKLFQRLAFLLQQRIISFDRRRDENKTL